MKSNIVNILRLCNLFILVIFLNNCTNSDFNFKYYGLNSDGERVLLAKGNLGKGNVPEGKFEIYGIDGEMLGSGKYLGGLKHDLWNYQIGDSCFSIMWKSEKYDSLQLSIPSNYKRQLDSTGLNYHLSINNIIIEQIYISIYNISQKDFNFFCDSYFENWSYKAAGELLDISNLFHNENKELNYTIKRFKLPYNEQFEVEIIAGIIRPNDKSNEAIELLFIQKYGVNNLAPVKFAEIAYDLHYNHKPLFNYFGLEYSNAIYNRESKK